MSAASVANLWMGTKMKHTEEGTNNQYPLLDCYESRRMERPICKCIYHLSFVASRKRDDTTKQNQLRFSYRYYTVVSDREE